MTPAEFRAIRHRLGLSVAEMARLLEISASHLYHLEADNASRPPVNRHMAKLMRVFDFLASKGISPEEALRSQALDELARLDADLI